MLFFPLCARAEPAAELELALVLPSRRTLDVDDAAFFEVTFVESTWDNALPAADLDVLLVDVFVSTVDAFFATEGLVDFVDLVAIYYLCCIADNLTVKMHAEPRFCDA